MDLRPANRWIVSEHYRGYRLDRFLQAMIPKVSRAKIQSAIRERVTVSWHDKPRSSSTVLPGGIVTIFFPRVTEPAIPAHPPILFEDEHIMAADKPAGLLVHPTHSCLRNNLIHLLRADRPGVPLALAHRLDRETSGIILLTKSTETGRRLATMFEKRRIEKTYLAIAHGRPREDAGRIDAPLGVSQRLQVVFKRAPDGKNAQGAVTDFRVLSADGQVSLIELSPRTGRRHQLRAHLAALGHPIVGDKLYGLSDRDFLRHLRGRLADETRRALLAERQLLHAFRLRFEHPFTGRPLCLEAPLPEDMRAFLEVRGLAPPDRAGRP
jgi:23S rRNA pseudouridine1911/1915/1917 synthase